MMKQIEKCPICQAEYILDSEEYYWHLKIHTAKEEIFPIKTITPNPEDK